MSDIASATIGPEILRAWLHDGHELAIVDVRSQFEFGQKNLFHASSLPLDRLELMAADLLPRRNVRIVVIDLAGEVAELGASRLRDLGYSDVTLLEDGIEGWERAALPIYSGVHVPSKAFAEVLEESVHTPSIDVTEFDTKVKAGEDIVLLDGRSFPEYQRLTMPGATNVPNAELVKHVRDLVPDRETLVVVACGGRTRSIVGAQALINAGLPNKVVSLRNGLMAWRLSGLPTEADAARHPGKASAQSVEWGEEAGRRVADRYGVRRIGFSEFARRRADASRTTYLLDVRTPDEYEAGHLPGSLSAPGGQLVQETDSYVAVRNAHVVLIDDAFSIRANITASWLVQLGLKNVAILEGGLGAEPLVTGPHRPEILGLDRIEGKPRHTVSPAELAALLADQGAIVVDVDLSPRYRAAHIPGAWWGQRHDLVSTLHVLPSGGTIVLTSADGNLARFAALDLAANTSRSITVLQGGTDGWIAAGLPIERGFQRKLGYGQDVWLPPGQREGNIEAAMREYLAWEIDLARSVAHDPDVSFAIAAHPRAASDHVSKTVPASHLA